MKLEEHELEDIARRVADILARRMPVANAAEYTSYRLPPDVVSRQRFNRLAKDVPGAVRRGRSWTVDAAAWRAFRSQKAPAPVVAPTAKSLAEQIATAAGYRRV